MTCLNRCRFPLLFCGITVGLSLFPISASAVIDALTLMSRGDPVIIRECCYNFTGCTLNQSYIVGNQTFVCGETAQSYDYTQLFVIQAPEAMYLCDDHNICYQGTLYNNVQTLPTPPYPGEYDVYIPMPYNFNYENEKDHHDHHENDRNNGNNGHDTHNEPHDTSDAAHENHDHESHDQHHDH